MTIDTETKLKMVRESLTRLMEAVGASPIKHLSPVIAEAYYKACSTMDALAFTESREKKPDKS